MFRSPGHPFFVDLEAPLSLSCGAGPPLMSAAGSWLATWPRAQVPSALSTAQLFVPAKRLAEALSARSRTLWGRGECSLLLLISTATQASDCLLCDIQGASLRGLQRGPTPQGSSSSKQMPKPGCHGDTALSVCLGKVAFSTAGYRNEVFSQQCLSALQRKKILFLVPRMSKASIIFISKFSCVTTTGNL